MIACTGFAKRRSSNQAKATCRPNLTPFEAQAQIPGYEQRSASRLDLFSRVSAPAVYELRVTSELAGRFSRFCGNSRRQNNPTCSRASLQSC